MITMTTAKGYGGNGSIREFEIYMKEYEVIEESSDRGPG